MNKTKKIVLWISLGLASAAFAAAGLAKLAGVEQMHMSFATMGLPAWFGYFIGAAELAGAVGLWLRRTSIYASAGLFSIMLGAMYFHVVYDTAANAVPALVLALLLINIFVKRRGQSHVSAD
ncbi:DoxX family protein [Paraglaciecola hydrolytica]|uniref:DoxX family protein n=1 Tax=Paraglaciecola hydrolytica TaxID=1799789 RepID=A0A148KK88_9ALTE|nr:DoxX family protein [Paraglaciecola hydrolytica]KXI26734.1 DoxX family protein [Paraglaciecola hydrolytica]